MIEMIVTITPACIVSRPVAVGVNMGCIGMSSCVSKLAVAVAARCTSKCSGAVARNESTADAMRAPAATMHAAATAAMSAALRKSGSRTHQQKGKK
jgi:hypothetical protein